MASTYPGAVDSFDTIASDKKTSDAVGGRTHRAMHNDLGDAIEAVQTELGTDPAGAYDTVKARFEAIEGSTLPQVDAKGDLIVGTADNTYDNLTAGSNDTVLVADSAQAKGVKWAQVPTAAIQDGAVTAAKLATTGRFLFPTGAANGYGFTGGAVHLEGGSSSPEGVVTANPGSTFLQTSGAATVTGMLSWRKATGTGNTGWVPEGALADTGWRDVSASMTTAGTTKYPNGKVAVRRVGSRVEYIVYTGASAVDGAGATTIYDIPAGFCAKVLWTYRSVVGAMVDAFSGQPTMDAGLYIGSGVSLVVGQSATAGAGSTKVGSLTGIVDDNTGWPTSLPGVAA